MRKPIMPFLMAIVLVSSCSDSESTAKPGSIDEPVVNNDPVVISYTILNATPHDTGSFTEGLLIHDGKMYESSGAPEDLPDARSIFGEVDRRTGKIAVKAELDRKTYFGEGITFLNGKVYQLTWQNKIGFVYDASTFKRIGQFTIPSAEGWGMTTDGSSLILSDGTSNLTFLDPETFKTIRVVGVTDNNGPVGNINELEYVRGSIYANIYESAYIVRIDPSSGKITGKADFSKLSKEVKEKDPQADFMNGIAYDSVSNKLYITGKLWPSIYEVRINN